MPEASAPRFRGGRNIAMKIPPHQFAATVAFYRDVARLSHLGTFGSNELFEFGAMRLWLNPLPTISQAEIWLELQADDPGAAARHLEASGVARCDQIERLPGDFEGFWIVNPAGIVHLAAHPSEGPEISSEGPEISSEGPEISSEDPEI
jgi:hypothetical protein